MCVNALKGATLISTVVNRETSAEYLHSCQCPERGDTAFLLDTCRKWLTQKSCVNALKGATLHFYTCLREPA